LLGTPRTDPDELNSSIRLLPWVFDGEALIGLPYAAQRLGHALPALGPVRAFSIAAQWLACTFPCRRFADILADACARLGADVDRYSFIAVDLHHLLLAGLPAHLRHDVVIGKCIWQAGHCRLE